MARLGVSKKKKSPHATQLSQLKKEVQRLTQQLESRDREQTATSEILRVIADSPTDLQPVMNVLAENAARLCEGSDAVIFRIEGDTLQCMANYGPMPVVEMQRPIMRGSPGGRAIIDRQTIHVHDIAAEVETEFPEYKHIQERMGTRTVLAAPLLREGVPIGVIFIRRTEVRPFSDKQIGLLKIFADQAVIAIENVRLFNELKESLEQQTATSEILGVIASSPTDIQPVLDVVVENAARLCEASDAQILRIDGDILRLAASYGPLPSSQTRPINRQLVSGRAVIDRQTIHVHDITVAEDEFPYTRTLGIPRGSRSFLATPLLCKGDPIGAIVIRRTEVCPFSEKQIALLKIFADQAVIAIENVRLFQELKESLEQQTATSQILGVIASSPTDIQPVLDVVAENAARLCDASDASIHRIDGDMLQRVAVYGPMPIPDMRRPITRAAPTGRAIVDRETIHVRDLAAEIETEYPQYVNRSTRTALATPLLREGIPIGLIFIRRTEVRPFSDRQIDLLRTFADQAVIAIENVRLFKEIQ